ncbi:hypothetical protein BaRGS_00023474 [Batillaria attramentaria]|uniref:Uncharacterized protein n=1 Tax=Batillaria attramentaria TaxID=370345 RepID=A0ABD0KDR4_9CAEN
MEVLSIDRDSGDRLTTHQPTICHDKLCAASYGECHTSVVPTTFSGFDLNRRVHGFFSFLVVASGHPESNTEHLDDWTVLLLLCVVWASCHRSWRFCETPSTFACFVTAGRPQHNYSIASDLYQTTLLRGN